MIELKDLFEIYRDATKSIRKDSDDNLRGGIWNNTLFILSFYILPIGASIVIWYKNIKLSDLETFIGTGIAIFTGLFFSLLLSVGDKIRNEKNNCNRDNNNFIRYKNNMRQISDIIQYVVFLGIVIFILMLINLVFKCKTVPLYEKTFTAIASFLLTQFLVCLFYMIQRFRHVVKNEIDNIL
nr:hypothetical protein [uncultured Carboxylicivirga sp.]